MANQRYSCLQINTCAHVRNHRISGICKQLRMWARIFYSCGLLGLLRDWQKERCEGAWSHDTSSEKTTLYYDTELQSFSSWVSKHCCTIRSTIQVETTPTRWCMPPASPKQVSFVSPFGHTRVHHAFFSATAIYIYIFLERRQSLVYKESRVNSDHQQYFWLYIWTTET